MRPRSNKKRRFRLWRRVVYPFATLFSLNLTITCLNAPYFDSHFVGDKWGPKERQILAANLTQPILILISSVPRKQEKVCSTVKSILQNFQTTKRENTPHILVHRYGDFPCEKALLAKREVTFRQYPGHATSNKQQRNDYLNLMEDGSQMLVEKHNISFSHAMFLDDDVELCPSFGSVLETALATFPSFGMGHFGRGGSGIIVPAENFLQLRDSLKFESRNSIQHVDKFMLEWALRHQRVCTIRPLKIQMLHVGLKSSFHREGWKDTDRCEAPSNNVAWQGLSESASVDFFGEYCINPPWCSPYSSIDNCLNCTDGFSGKDCGIPTNDDGTRNYKRRKNAAAIVALLSGVSEEDILDDLKKHKLINLYVIGNQRTKGWITENAYSTTKEALVALKEELKDSARWGAMAFSTDDTIFVDKLVSPQDLWTIKYYLRGS